MTVALWIVVVFWVVSIANIVWWWRDEVRYRRQRRYEDEAMRLANTAQRHPSRRGPLGPEDEARWEQWAWKENH